MDEVKELLREAHVPKEAFKTTLLREGYENLRTFIEAGAAEIICIYPAQPSAAYRSSLVAYTMAKEMVLARRTTYCCDTSDMALAFSHEVPATDWLDKVRAGIENADVVMLHAFMGEETAVPYMTPMQAAVVASYIRRTHSDAGTSKTFILHGLCPPDKWARYWPEWFVRYLGAVALVQAVSL